MKTNSESARIAEQLRRASDGTAWHGPALLELLENVDASTAAAKPLCNVHSIWELVLHIAAWDGAVRRRLGGEKLQPHPGLPANPQTNERCVAKGRC